MSTEQQRQRVSALMDGEAARFEAAAAVSDLVQSPDLCGRWERWHLIGRAMRGEPNALAARDTAARVRAQVAGQAGGGADTAQTAPGVGRPRRPMLGRHLAAVPRAGAPLYGAMAAGVVVLGLAVVLTGPLLDQRGIAPRLAAVPQTAERWQQPDPAVRARLDRLLVNHQEQLPGIGRSGVAAYAAVIGYERRP